MPRIDRYEVGGVTLAVRSWPCRAAACPPVVLLPGTGATAGDWDVIAAEVSADSGVALVRRLVLEETGVPHPRPAQPPARPAGPLLFDWAVVEQIRPEIDEPDPRWPQVMAAIHVPALVIGGGTSSFLSQEDVAELATTVADGTRVTIDAGHLVHATKPAEFLAELKAFLDS